MMFAGKPFEGQVALITGGGTGLGRAMALRFAQLGAAVGLSGRRSDPLEQTAGEIRAAGGRAAWATCDVREPKAVAEAFDKLGGELGHADVLVNNAAGNFLCPSEELSPPERIHTLRRFKEIDADLGRVDQGRLVSNLTRTGADLTNDLLAASQARQKERLLREKG